MSRGIPPRADRVGRCGSSSVALVLVLLLVPTGSGADEVRLASGEVFEGEVQLDELEIAVESGEVVVPVTAVRSLHSVASGGVRLELVDGELVVGEPLFETIPLQQGLLIRRLRMAEVESVTFPPPRPEDEILRTHREGEFASVDRLSPTADGIEVSCPLRVETKLPTPLERERWTLSRMRAVRCDGVIGVSAVQFEAVPMRTGGVELKTVFYIDVRPSHDKLVSLDADLMLADSMIGRVREREIDAEEERVTAVRTSVFLGAETVRQWREGADLRMRIEVDAVDH